MPFLRGIETFVKTVEGGSIAAAARQLGITAAAASQNLARLESELGTRLLTRTTRSQALTEAGKAYFARVGPILKELVQAHAEVAGFGDSVQGKLKIASWVTFGRHVVAPLLPAFMERHPQVHLELLLTDDNVDHLRAEVDVGIRSRHGLEPGLVARRIATVQMVFCASPAYLAKHGCPLRPTDLVKHACIAFRMPFDGRLMPWPFLSDGQRILPQLNIAAVCNDNDTIAALAVAGAGITRMSSFVANPLIERGLLEPLFLQNSAQNLSGVQPNPEPLEFFVAYRDRQYVSTPVRAFVDYIVEALDIIPSLQMPPRNGRK